MDTRTDFDPLGDVFLAQLEGPPQGAGVNLRTLTPFHRALLAIDGTVTRFLEAYTMEPVEVSCLAQVSRRLEQDHEWLAAARGEEIVVRHVQIRGEYSHRLYVYAVSYVAFGRLPDEVRARVESERDGLGRILALHKLETRREVLWYGRERMADLPPAIDATPDREFVSRTYRIFHRDQPIMLINEKFPTSIDLLPEHH